MIYSFAVFSVQGPYWDDVVDWQQTFFQSTFNYYFIDALHMQSVSNEPRNAFKDNCKFLSEPSLKIWKRLAITPALVASSRSAASGDQFSCVVASLLV